MNIIIHKNETCPLDCPVDFKPVSFLKNWSIGTSSSEHIPAMI